MQQSLDNHIQPKYSTSHQEPPTEKLNQQKSSLIPQYMYLFVKTEKTETKIKPEPSRISSISHFSMQK